MNIETFITLGYYISSIGFLAASIITLLAVRKFGKSALGSIFSYLFIGTVIFFVITIFQKLGGDFFKISHESVDIWWHIMFYMALIFYYYGLKFLVGLGSTETDSNQGVQVGAEKKWGILALILLVVIFIIPSWAESIMIGYDSSPLGQLGLHHFLAFILSGIVGSYLFSAKKNLGQIGRAIANPMIVAVWALSIQHLWELSTESWKVIEVTGDNIEGVEKIFLIIASISIAYAAWRLKSFAKA